MDPYIEASGLWEDFHHNLITGIQRGISAVLPERYIVLARERTYEPERCEGFLEISDLNQVRTLVTRIEALSPSNKQPGTVGSLQYKRRAYLASGAHFVEIDLVRTGRRMPMEDEWPDSPYCLLVCRKHEAPRCTVWSAHFLHPLPAIPIPLSPPDLDVTIALQPLVESVYAHSHYDRIIDYRKSVKPPLSPSEAAWLQAQLAQPPVADAPGSP